MDQVTTAKFGGTEKQISQCTAGKVGRSTQHIEQIGQVPQYKFQAAMEQID